jgi:SsrA-binding protein
MKTLIQNRKATQSYEVIDTYESGIVLAGYEVVALRSGSGSLRGSYVIIDQGQAVLKNCSIPLLQTATAPKSYDDTRDRRLLFKKQELRKLVGKTQEKGLTLVPLSLYSSKRFIKVNVALVRSKNKHDKRASLKKRDDNRDMARTLKRNR